MGFKFLEHTADAKIEVEEKTLNKAFSTAAFAMKEVIAEQILVAPRIKQEIHVKADNKEALLYSFLEEFLYLLDTEGFILSKAPLVKIEKAKEGKGFSLKAKAIGDSAKNYIFTNDVKAITYNDMLIEEEKDKCTIVFVLDV
jgi:SHS2 domain-containing protein